MSFSEKLLWEGGGGSGVGVEVYGIGFQFDLEDLEVAHHLGVQGDCDAVAGVGRRCERAGVSASGWKACVLFRGRFKSGCDLRRIFDERLAKAVSV